MSPLAVVLLTAAGTYLLRVSLIALLQRVEISDEVRDGLRLIAPAALAALVAQGLLVSGGQLRPVGSWHAAAVVAALVAVRSRSMGFTLAAGMAAVWAFGAIL